MASPKSQHLAPGAGASNNILNPGAGPSNNTHSEGILILGQEKTKICIEKSSSTNNTNSLNRKQRNNASNQGSNNILASLKKKVTSTIEEKSNSTAFGHVEEAVVQERPVILKTLYLKKVDFDPDLFKHEVEKLALIRHPGIVDVLGYLEDTCTFIMEKVDPYLTLEQHIITKAHSLTFKERFKYIQDVAEAMKFLHSNLPAPHLKSTLIHSQLTSAHILLVPDQERLHTLGIEYRCRLVCVGFSALRSAFVKQKRIFLNSPYLAPELKQSTTYSTKTDVYAYGVVLLHVYLCKHPKYLIKDFEDKMKKQSIPDACHILIPSCLELIAKKRFTFEMICSFLETHQQAMFDFIPVEIKTESELVHLDLNTQQMIKTKKEPLAMPQEAAKSSLTLLKARKTWLATRRGKIIAGSLVAILALAIALIIVMIHAFTPVSPAATPSSTPLTTRNQRPWNMWGGINSYFLFALNEEDQDRVIQKAKNAGLRVLRVYVTAVQPNFRQSFAEQVPDVQIEPLGSFDETLLYKMDHLMMKLVRADMKMILVLHDRNMLGCTGSDVYVNAFKIPVSDKGTCYSLPNNATEFYYNPEAIQAFDRRIQFILSHRHPQLDNTTWAELNQVIYGIEIQNESQGKLIIKNPRWLCDRAKLVKSLISRDIKVVASQGGTVEESLQLAAFECPFIDAVGIHTLTFNEIHIVQMMESVDKLMALYNKTILFSGIGSLGNRPLYFSRLVSFANFKKIPWLIWNVVDAAKDPQRHDFYEDAATWDIMTKQALQANTLNDQLNSTVEYVAPSASTSVTCMRCKSNWVECSDSAECKGSSSCCMGVFSSGVNKCTPGGC